MTNPLQGPDEETHERMTGTLNRLRGMVAQCRKNGIKARRFQVDDLAFLLSRVDSLESALREATQDVRKQFADEGFEIPSVKDAAELINEYSGMIRVEAARRIAAERLHARHCGLECCEVRDEYDARTRQSPIGADTGEST